MLNIRSGTSADDAICGKIVGAAATASVYYDRVPQARKLLEDTSPLEMDDRDRLIAELDRTPVAFADFRVNTGHIKYLFCLPESQGSGAGSALLDAVQKAVGGPISVHVLAVNDTGILWYMRRGFEVVSGFEKEFEGTPAAWLRLVRT